MRWSWMLSVGFVAGVGLACGEIESQPDAPSGQPDSGMSIDGGSDVELAIDKVEHDFGTVVTGASSAATTFTISNTGTAPTGVLTVTLAGDDAAEFILDADDCGDAPLGAGESCEISVSFEPTQAGASVATLSVAGTPGGQVDAELSGDAVTPGALSVAPTSTDFGAVIVGNSSAATTFTVTNTGGTATGTLAVALTGSDLGQFTIGTDDCTGETLGGGASCTVTVSLAPSSAGAKAASLTVTGSPGGTAVAALSGSGVNAAVLSITPASYDYGAVVVGMSATQVFTVTNGGDQTTGALAVTRTGAEFTITADTCNGQAIAGGGSCAITVQFAPGTSGVKAGMLSVTGTPGGATGATLGGSGLTPGEISLTPTTHDFGTVVLGANATQVFTVTNSGQQSTGALAVTANGADFTITADTCNGQMVAGGGTCAVTVRFAPATSGAKSGSLTVTGSPGGTAMSNLSGAGQTPAVIDLTPATQDFGTVVVGANASQVFTVTNTGQQSTGALAVSLTGADFTITANTCTGQILAGSGTCTVTVQFGPSSAGAKTGSLTISGTPGGSDLAALSGTGQSPAVLSMTPASHNYGNVVVGANASQVFTVTNGGQQSSGTLTVTRTGSADFTIIADGCSGVVVAGGATCTVTVRFAPSSGGAKSGTLAVSGTPGGSDSSSLSGTGLTPASIAMTPASHNYGNVVVGANASQVFTVTNSGQQSTGTLTVTRTGSADYSITADTCNGQVLAGSGTCTVTVRFAPSSGGAKSGTLAVSGTPGGSDSSSLSGTGLTPASIAMTPASHNYGNVLVGSNASQVFTVTNNGQQSTGTLAISRTGSADYSITADTCNGQVLAGSATCTVTVRFAPSSGGAKSGTLAVSGTPGGSDSSSLSGTGVTPAVLSMTPASHNYGNILVGSNSSQVFTVTNGGQQSSGTLTVTRTGSTDYSITADTCSGQVLAGSGTCTVTVRFAPSSGGAKSGTLAVSGTPGGSDSSSLSGAGVTPASIEMTPSSHNYGNVLVGSNSSQVFTVTNNGQQSTGTLTITRTGSADYSITSNNCNGQVLAGSGTCTVTVRFAPSSAGSKTGTLAVSGSPGGSDSSSLSGNGQDPAVLGGSPGTLAFGGHEVSVSSSSLTWTITNSGDVPTGTLSFSNSNTAEFSTTTTCGTTLAGGASCTVSATFRPSTGGSRSGTLTMSATPGGSIQASMTGTGMYRLNVDRTGTGHVGGTGINCGTDCTELFAPGASVTLTATPTNGSGRYFGGWSNAPGCTGPGRTCTVTMSQSRTVGASFPLQPHNLVFMTSSTYPTDLGSVLKYDDQCNLAATAAGINTSNNQGFVAHISGGGAAASFPAIARIGNANGWIRMDGKAFARDQDTLFNQKAVLNPVRFDEYGRDLGNQMAMTGSTSSGTTGERTCSNWTSTSAQLSAEAGYALGGPEFWSSGSALGCASSWRLICMGNSHFEPLVPAVSQGKRIYRTAGTFFVGPNATPDQYCEANKPAGTGTVRALVAYTHTPASSFLSASTTYVRPDGQVVGTGSQILAGGTLESGIWQANDGRYSFTTTPIVWTGHTTLTGTGTTASTCGNWANSQAGSGAHLGYFPFATSWFWSIPSSGSCSTVGGTVPLPSGFLYCVEQ